MAIRNIEISQYSGSQFIEAGIAIIITDSGSDTGSDLQMYSSEYLINNYVSSSEFNSNTSSFNNFTQSYYIASESFDNRLNEKLNSSSFDAFTQSYYIDSQSFNQKIDNLTAENIQYTNSIWNTNDVNNALNKLTTLNNNIGATGRLNENALIQTAPNELFIYANDGYIIYDTVYKYVTWNSQSLDTTGFSEGGYYVYIDSNGDLQYNTTYPNKYQNIILGYFYHGGEQGFIGVTFEWGSHIDNFTVNAIGFMQNLGAFITDLGCNVSLTGANTRSFVSTIGSAQWGTQTFPLTEINPTHLGTRLFSFYKSADAGWTNDYNFIFTGGEIDNRRYNDITANSYDSASANCTFVNNDIYVTTSIDLTSEIEIGNYVYLEDDTDYAMGDVIDITTSIITLSMPYRGAGGTGNTIINKSLPLLPSGSFVKGLIARTLNDNCYYLMPQNYFNTEADAVSAGLPQIPEAISKAGLKCSTPIYECSGSITLRDIRPLPFSDREGGSQTGGTSNLHADLQGLNSDDHTQYILTNGNRNLTGIQKYASSYTFTTDDDIISKKYVDDKVLPYLLSESFNSYTQSNDIKIDNLNLFTQSYNIDSESFDYRINEKIDSSSFNTFTQSYYIDSASFNTMINDINDITASYLIASSSIDIRINEKLNSSSFNSYTQSNNIYIDNLNIQSSSINTFTQSYNIDSGSFDVRINQKIDSSSFNSFTQSYYIASESFDNRLNEKLNSSSFDAFTQSNNIYIDNLNIQSSSINIFTQSYYVDSASFNTRILSISGSSLTNIAYTTASNIFTADQTITGSLNITGNYNGVKLITSGSGSNFLNDSGSYSLCVQPAYGFIRENNPTADTTITITANVWTGWVTATSILHYLTEFTNDATADRITMLSGSSGIYDVLVSMDVRVASQNQDHYVGVFLNNSVQHRKFLRQSSANQWISLELPCLLELSPTDYVDVRFTAPQNRTIYIRNTSLKIVRIK